MFRLASVISSAIILAGCAGTPKPASIDGECRVFSDPGFPVQGKTPRDQRWISVTQEAGIASCGWKRPKAEG